MVDLTRSTQEWLHPALIGQGMCPDCACPQEQHGTFGWTGCDQRFDADVLAPGGRGTADMVGRCEKAGVKIIDLRYTASPSAEAGGVA